MRRSSAVLIAALLLAACTDPVEDVEETRPPAPPPNVLIIVTDDQRFDQIAHMKALQRWFGDGGITYANAYATTPLCCPGRAAIMTGQYSHNNGVERNNDGPLLDQDSTLQRYLHDNGYRTAIAGKFLQGIAVTEDPPNFDKWSTFGWGYYDRLFNIGGEMRTVARYSTDFLATESVRYIRAFERQDDRPWFLYVAPTAPHLPYTARRDLQDEPVPAFEDSPAMDEVDRSDKPPYVRASDFGFEKGAQIFEKQLRTLLSVDKLVARLFQALGRLDEREVTLAIYTSDNGHMLGEHGLFAKRMPYDASVRIPLLMRFPSHAEAGTEDLRMVANIDIAPTVLAAAGISPDDSFPLDGRDLLSDHTRDRLLLEQHKNIRMPDWASLLTAESQYVEYYAEDDPAERVFLELYDLVADPFQLENLLGDGLDPEADPAAAEAARDLAKIRDCVGSECP